MLICADWVLPISRKPIRDGAVAIVNGHVAAVGRKRELLGAYEDQECRVFRDSVLMPGLVNAHTHLALTALQGLVPPVAFEQWLPQLVTAMKSWSHDDFAASAAVGAERMLEAGCTVIGDVVYGPESVAAAADNGLGGVYFWELLGIDADELPAVLERAEFPVVGGGRCGMRTRCGLSPHSVYTAGPRLLQAVRETALELDVPFAIHVAESTAETRLLRDGDGPLAGTAARMAKGFKPPGTGSITYLDRLGALDGATAVHLCQCSPTEIPRLAATVRGIVTCPRSNRYLSNPIPRVDRFLRSGVPVGIGTDSVASNYDLDLMADVRCLHDAEPDIPVRTLVEMVTAMGAIAIGVEDRFGILEPGMEGDVAIFKIGRTEEPEAAVVRLAGRETVDAVMASGVWRVLEGKVISPNTDAAAAAAAAAARAAKVLGS